MFLANMYTIDFEIATDCCIVTIDWVPNDFLFQADLWQLHGSIGMAAPDQ